MTLATEIGMNDSLALRPFWHDDINLETQTTPLNQLDTQTDVLIVGSGFTGLSAALTLARAGKKVILVDSQKIGYGASSRNGGLLGPSFHKLGLNGLMDKFGVDIANAILQESLSGFEWLLDFIKTENIDCDLRRSGRFRGALKKSHFYKMAQQAESLAAVLDYPVNVIDRAQQHTEVGSSIYQGGIVYTKDACLHPGKLVKGLIERVQQANVTLVQQERVDVITPYQNGFQVKVNQLTINADAVLIATNGYTDQVTAGLKKRIIPIRSSMIATAELPADLIHSVSPKLRSHGGSDRLVFYYRPSPDGRRLLFGGRALSYRDKPSEYVGFLQRHMCHLFPQLAQANISYAWSGLVAYSFDHIPHLGLHNGMHYAMGYCGSGVARANYLGHKIALKMLKNNPETPQSQTIFDQFPFPSRPFYQGNPWFMPAVLRWHSLADKLGL